MEERDVACPAVVVAKAKETQRLPCRGCQRPDAQVVKQWVAPHHKAVKIDANGHNSGLIAVPKLPAKAPLGVFDHFKDRAPLDLLELCLLLRIEGPSNELDHVAAPDLREGCAQEPALEQRCGAPARAQQAAPRRRLLPALHGAAVDVHGPRWRRQALCHGLWSLQPAPHQPQPDSEAALGHRDAQAQEAQGQEEPQGRDHEGRGEEHAPGEHRWGHDDQGAAQGPQEGEQGTIDELRVQVIQVTGADMSAASGRGTRPPSLPGRTRRLHAGGSRRSTCSGDPALRDKSQRSSPYFDA
mmetsp:Transcript_34839/g.105013  ORF Transcript_34839/g.105013 Transcript_34839/m.105013 type:complete len:298 (-) Transcript_34839:53-946(-)